MEYQQINLNLRWGQPTTPEMVEEALSTGKYDLITLL